MPVTTVNRSPSRASGPRRSRRSGEFILYFTLIFFFALPFASVEWIAMALRRRTLNLRGPLARAWAEADRITPLIFTR